MPLLVLISWWIQCDGRSPSMHLARAKTVGWIAVLATIMLSCAELCADEPLAVVPRADTSLDADVFADSTPAIGANDLQFDLSEHGYCDGCDQSHADCQCGGLNWPRLGMYVKAGPSGQWSEDLFKDHTSLGYQLSLGGREPLFPANRTMFFDFGGSYLSAYGRGDPLTIGGTITRGALAPQRVNEMMDLTLEEISRAGLHAAVGWYHDVSPTPDDSRLITLRVGGRLSHIHGHFREDATDALQTIIDTAVAAGQRFSLANDPVISRTDTSPGIFAGIELDHTRQLTPGATISLLVDGEFASDWIDLKNYADGALVTASLLFGVSISR